MAQSTKFLIKWLPSPSSRLPTGFLVALQGSLMAKHRLVDLAEFEEKTDGHRRATMMLHSQRCGPNETPL